MPILVFILAWPFIQSTIVLLSPFISSVGFSPGTSVPKSRRGRSLGFFVGTDPLDSISLSTGCFIDSSWFVMTSSLEGCVCVTSCIQSFSIASPSSHRCPNESIFIPKEDRLLHRTVVLHPKMERRASIIGTSPSYTAHVKVVQRLFAIFSVSSGKPIFRLQDPHKPRCSDFVGHRDFIWHCARSEGEAQIWDSHARTLLIMAPLHGQLILPFSTVSHLQLVVTGTVLERKMYLSRHQLLRALHILRSAP